MAKFLMGVLRDASSLPREANSNYKAVHATPAETATHRYYLLFSALSATWYRLGSATVNLTLF